MNNPKLKKFLKIFIIVGICFIVLGSIFIITNNYFTVTEVDVVGNEHYTEDEIKKMVINDGLTSNSLFLNLKYKNKSITNIPFIQRMDVSIVSPKHIKIEVYEKAIAGYIEYLGHFLYFDRDGIIVESSTREVDNIPLVSGLEFRSVSVHEPIPVDDKEVFNTILTITKLLEKYDIKTDEISFSGKNDITLRFDYARVYIGKDDFIDEKINEISLIKDKLSGYSGTLHMENYKGEGGNFTFEKNDDEASMAIMKILNADDRDENEEMPEKSVDFPMNFN